MSYQPLHRRTGAPAATTPAAVVADVAGARAGQRRRAPGVEANARLTGATGLLLLVMLAAEGLTIVAIRPLLPWHIGIGLALIPPVALKVGSTLWRFARYYLGDQRYRRAGPPHPILRVLGPVVTGSTAALLATGIAVWLAGPGNGSLLFLHQASFAVWFAAMTVHVLGHVLDAARSTRADVVARGAARAAAPHRAARQALLVSSLVAGVAVALAARGVPSGWLTDFGRAR
ncbi:MAG TPA: hypothetical protein VFP61_06995 [Acidimicrobiales bacterium]|nr:hypothetical protein [Acidimicrobiales bacterium]